ncbi:MAG: hypothetical protein ABIP81_03425 [Terriglobales bacterium]
MATASAANPTLPPSAGAYDRVFYSTMAIAMALTVLIGFGPTYYTKIFGSVPMVTITGGPFTPIFHIHGALFTAWVVLFIVQTALVASHRVAVHRKLGIAGAVLAAAMVVAGVAAGITSAARGSAPPGISPLQFLAIPIFDMLVFSTLVIAALWMRRDKEAHKRLMVLGYISILSAAMARLPGVLPLGPLGFFGLSSLFLVAGILYDLVTRRRVHPAYLWGGSLFVVSVPLRLVISGTETWKAFAEALTRLI